ncbi:hypothetical protein FRC01_007436 [Tulasnella sp. 417]|nr:hypothetical protein FRC01_007436 [Tulasnella sp. 417]
MLLFLAVAFLALLSVDAAPLVASRGGKITPKIFIITMRFKFAPEGEVWYDIPEFNLLANNITVPGFSPLFPDAHCTSVGDICQVNTGTAEINAAATISALWLSDKFDLTLTYFFITGIAGVNPNVATISGVSFARYAVQVGLQYEIDPRELPANFSSGYFPIGSSSSDSYPVNIYGTEVFELNDALRKEAIQYAKTATLNDSDAAVAYRANYPQDAARSSPSVIGCDVATADAWWSGKILSDAFSNTTRTWTNGTGIYCATAQEDNATLEALVRGASAGKLDFGRVILMRTFSDFDQPYAAEQALFNLRYADQGAILPSISNIYLAGIKVVQGILTSWDFKFKDGIKPTNYIGDMFGTLGGNIKPDFGPGEAVYSGFRRRNIPVIP